MYFDNDDLFEEVKVQDYSYIWSIPNATIQESVPRTAAEIMNHNNIACSVSGGADSDIMLDIVNRLDVEKKVHYVFFDTGIEMRATLSHLDYLENRYGVKIERLRHETPIPVAVKKYGYPFLSKQISIYIERLQRHNFDWVDEPFDVLYVKYPKCKIALSWWCNNFYEGSRYNISYTPYLKEFMLLNPPKIKISPKCCDYGKKKPAEQFRKNNKIDITMIGIRKFEGGARTVAYKNCMSDGVHGLQHFPLFWFKDEDKKMYETACDIVHSDAYKVYGCKRTGCAGCPFGSGFEDELKMLEEHEPKLYKAVCNIFGPAYEYTRAYRKFRDEMKEKDREKKAKAEQEESGQMSLFE